jgi:CHAT domain-containing protein
VSAQLPGEPWGLVVDGLAVEALRVRLPEDGTPAAEAVPDDGERFRGLRLEFAGGGRLVARWGPDARWRGSWGPGRDGLTIVVTAAGGAHTRLDGWLTPTAGGARLDALHLSPGNGGTWPAVTRVAASMRPATRPHTPGPRRRTFTGTLTPGQGPPHPVTLSVGPPPRACRETTEPAMVLLSDDQQREGAVLWIAHCADGAEVTADLTGDVTADVTAEVSGAVAVETTAEATAAGPGPLTFTVRYGPEHDEAEAPTWNVPHTSPALPAFPLPVKAETALARLTLHGPRITGTVELTGHHPLTGARLLHRAELEAREAPEAPTVAERDAAERVAAADTVETDGAPAGPIADAMAAGAAVTDGMPAEPEPPFRTLAGEWLALHGPIPHLTLTPEHPPPPNRPGPDTAWHLTAPGHATTAAGTAFLRLFPPLDLAVGLVRPGGPDHHGTQPRILVLHRAATPPPSPGGEAVWDDRVELRSLAQRLVRERRWAEARPLLRRALALHRDAAAAGRPGQRHGEETSALTVLDQLALCDAALGDGPALVGRLAEAAGLRAALLGAGPAGTGSVPYTRELVTGTLQAMLGQARHLEDWRSRLGSDEERVAQVEFTVPFWERLVTVLLGLGEPATALLAAEAGRARAFADLLGRAAPGGRAPGGERAAEAGWILGAPPPLNPERLRRLLARHGHPVVAYHLAGDLLVRWTATPGGHVTAQPQRISVRELTQAVDVVRQAGRASGPAPRQVRAALRWLGPLLWPAEQDALLPADPDATVTVVPYGALARVPFAALPDATGRPLVERHAVTVLPALSLLEGLLDRAAARGAERRAPTLLALVDPEPMPTGLLPLPWTREWFPLVAELYGEGRATVHSGRRATAARLAAQAGTASVLCLATHAKAYDGADGTHPMDSYVALARTADHDGRLRARDLPGLGLGADLVILSACDSGTGRLTADGVIGLARSFLVRGPTSLLMTLSPVRQSEALDLVHRFHQHWLHDGHDRAAALRRAQLALAETYPEAPELWAFFALLGLGHRGLPADATQPGPPPATDPGTAAPPPTPSPPGGAT